MALFGTIPATANVVASAITGTLAKARLPAGSVLQVVGNSSTSNFTTSSTSYVASGVSVSITPSSASNKVLVMCNTGSMDQTGTIGNIGIALYKNGSSLKEIALCNYYSTGTELGNRSFVYLDSPSTTSATTYDIYFKTTNAAQTAYLNEGGSGTVSIVVMEIAG